MRGSIEFGEKCQSLQSGGNFRAVQCGDVRVARSFVMLVGCFEVVVCVHGVMPENKCRRSVKLGDCGSAWQLIGSTQVRPWRAILVHEQHVGK